MGLQKCIKLLRKNETLKFCEHFTCDEAMSLFNGKNGKYLPKQAEWDKMLETGYTLDSEKNGIWIGNQHKKKRETSESTFLPASGYRRYSVGTLDYAGTLGAYWSSTYDSTTSAYYLLFYSGYVNAGNNTTLKGFGFSVRCLSE